MDNAVQNIEFTTANGGHKVVLKPFITGFDKRAINIAIVDMPEGTGNATRAAMWDDARLKAVVVSISVKNAEGVEEVKTEDLANVALALDNRDYQEIHEKVDEVIGDKKKVTT